ncbi:MULTISPECIES: sensor histidine kinase [unclassified Moraxella]|uniref:sensor histidine kinase n=1 Tax=unclassified Moraxella TaxID=2685852 RepID=UPI003AF4D298
MLSNFGQHSLSNAGQDTLILWLARYVWLGIMLMVVLFTAQFPLTTPDSPPNIAWLTAVVGGYALFITLGHLLPKHWLERYLLWQLIADLLIWTGFLYGLGGASHPLITLLLTVVAVGAVLLPPRQIVVLSVVAIGLYGLLWWCGLSSDLLASSQPSPPLSPNSSSNIASPSNDSLHLLGMFAVFVLSLTMLTALTVYFKYAMSQSYHQLDHAQQALHQQGRLLAVSSLAANIAHELSTPIASIQMLADSMAESLAEADGKISSTIFQDMISQDTASELASDIVLLQSQIALCRASLTRLKTQIHTLTPTADKHTSILPTQVQAIAPNHYDDPNNEPQTSAMTDIQGCELSQALPQWVQDWRFLYPHIQVSIEPIAHAMTVSLASEHLQQLVVSLLNNAMQAHASHINILLTDDRQQITPLIQRHQSLNHHSRATTLVLLTLRDNGQGVTATTLEQINQYQPIDSPKGWGVGLLLTKTLLDYAGGGLVLEAVNAKDLGAGTQVQVLLPLME